MVLSVFCGSFRLVEALKGTIHALVEAPMTMHGDPVQVAAVLDQI